jgi:hypothetical protein
MSTGHATTIRRRLAATAAGAALLIGLAACGDSGGDSPDFTTADLERLSFAPADVPAMEYQPDRSGAGGLTKGGDNRDVAARLEKLGLESNYVSQFFATTRRSQLLFVESTVLLFEDEAAARAAMGPVERENLDSIDSSEAIDAPDLGEQAFGLRGKTDGYTVYSYGWRNGDAVQLVTVAPNGEKPGPRSTVRLAAQLEAKGERQ